MARYSGKTARLAVAAAAAIVLVVVAVLVMAKQTESKAIAERARALPPPQVHASAVSPSTRLSEPVAKLVPTNGRPKPVVLLLGDSYSNGAGADARRHGFAELVAAELGWDVEVRSTSGGGYVARGVKEDGPLASLAANADIASMKPDLVILQAGLNDAGADEVSLYNGVRDTFSVVQKAAPETPIIVIGMFWTKPPTVRSTENGKQIVYLAGRFGASLVLDPVTGGWNEYGTSVDGLHPDTAGHRLIADEIAAGLRDRGLA